MRICPDRLGEILTTFSSQIDSISFSVVAAAFITVAVFGPGLFTRSLLQQGRQPEPQL
jgi:multidrug efflux pump subunit AcrB